MFDARRVRDDLEAARRTYGGRNWPDTFKDRLTEAHRQEPHLQFEWLTSPGAWTEHDGARLKLWPASLAVPAGLDLGPGELMAAKNDVFVGTGSRPVRLGDVQPEGRQVEDLLSRRVGDYQYVPTIGTLLDQLWVR